MVILGRSVDQTTLFLDRLRLPKRLTNSSCTYFRQLLTIALLRAAEVETKVSGRKRVSNPGPLALESDELSTALRGTACFNVCCDTDLIAETEANLQSMLYILANSVQI